MMGKPFQAGKKIIDDAAENGDAPQSIDAKHERYKMKAFWLRKEPICEVCSIELCF
jgi:hypothetical protein